MVTTFKRRGDTPPVYESIFGNESDCEIIELDLTDEIAKEAAANAQRAIREQNIANTLTTIKNHSGKSLSNQEIKIVVEALINLICNDENLAAILLKIATQS